MACVPCLPSIGNHREPSLAAPGAARKTDRRKTREKGAEKAGRDSWILLPKTLFGNAAGSRRQPRDWAWRALPSSWDDREREKARRRHAPASHCSTPPAILAIFNNFESRPLSFPRVPTPFFSPFFSLSFPTPNRLADGSVQAVIRLFEHLSYGCTDRKD